jgi:hypothetical protein
MSWFGSTGGPWERPPAIFGPQVPGQASRWEDESQRVLMMPLTLISTSEPVWPEDEAREKADNPGRYLPELAPEDIAFRMARELRVSLPDRLFGQLLELPANQWLDTDSYDYVAFCVPTSISGPTEIVPRRMRLELKLDSDDKVKPRRLPVAFELHPESQVVSNVTNIGEFKVDLGKAAQLAMGQFLPGMPPVFTAKMGGSLDVTRINMRIQAAGLNSHRCEWRIADTKIAYDFNPACVVQVPKGVELTVSATLHVEARQRIALVFYRNYVKNADPIKYVLSAPVVRYVNPASLSDRSKVTLRRPGMQYADEDQVPYIESEPETALRDILSPQPLTEEQIRELEGTLFKITPTADAEETAAHELYLGSELRPESQVGGGNPASVAEELIRLASLLDKGLLTQGEFELLKAKLIAGS